MLKQQNIFHIEKVNGVVTRQIRLVASVKFGIASKHLKDALKIVVGHGKEQSREQTSN